MDQSTHIHQTAQTTNPSELNIDRFHPDYRRPDFKQSNMALGSIIAVGAGLTAGTTAGLLTKDKMTGIIAGIITAAAVPLAMLIKNEEKLRTTRGQEEIYNIITETSGQSGDFSQNLQNNLQKLYMAKENDRNAAWLFGHNHALGAFLLHPFCQAQPILCKTLNLFLSGPPSCADA